MTTKAEELLTELVLLKSTFEDDMKPIVGFVTSELKRLGLKPRYYGKAEHPALVAQHRSGGVVLAGHLDTVPHGSGWKFEEGEVVDGFLYGRGSCDMKGGCAAMLLAAADLVAAKVPFTLCFTTDEEVTMDGAAAAAKDPSIAKAPAVLIAEPSNLEIVVKEKGQLEFSLSTKGKACHSSMPQLGDNAIARMTSLLKNLDDLQRIPRNPTAEMTLSVNTIKGGTRVNVVPDSCEVEIDVRYPASMSQNDVLATVRRRIGANGYELRIIHNLDPVEVDPTSAPVVRLKEIIGSHAKIAAVPYATEMVMFSKRNPRTLICGPGDAAGCHIADERIEVRQVTRAAELYTEYCARLSKK